MLRRFSALLVNNNKNLLKMKPSLRNLTTIPNSEKSLKIKQQVLDLQGNTIYEHRSSLSKTRIISETTFYRTHYLAPLEEISIGTKVIPRTINIKALMEHKEFAHYPHITIAFTSFRLPITLDPFYQKLSLITSDKNIHIKEANTELLLSENLWSDAKALLGLNEKENNSNRQHKKNLSYRTKETHSTLFGMHKETREIVETIVGKNSLEQRILHITKIGSVRTKLSSNFKERILHKNNQKNELHL